MMKKILAAFSLALCMLPSAPASAITVTFNPASSHIDVGETVHVAVNISGLGPEILSAFDVDLLYDPLILITGAVTHNAVLQFGGFPANSYIDSSFGFGRTGVIDGSLLDDAQLAATQADSFTILTFSMRGLADGVSLLTFGPDPDFERNFVGLNALSLVVDVGSACVAVGTGACVAQIPEPGSLALVALALAGACVRRRRLGRGQAA